MADKNSLKITISGVFNKICNKCFRFFFERIQSQKAFDILVRNVAFKALNIKFRNIKLHVNNVCNLRCKNCYCDFSLEESLSCREICNLISQLRPVGGNLKLQLLGGEPLLRGDLFEIINYAKRKIKHITIYTNATLVTPRLAARIKQAGVSAVIVNLYSCYKDIHDGITQTPGSWEKTQEGIRNLIAAGLPTHTFTVLMSVNVNHLKQIDDFARGLKAKTMFFPYIKQGSCDLQPEDRKSFQYAIDWAYNTSKAYKNKLLDVLSKRPKACSAFISTINIKSDGTVTPCPFLNLNLGNIKNEKFYAIINNSCRNQDLLDFLSIPEGCRACSLVRLCGGGCKAYRFNNYRDAISKDFNCNGPYSESIPLEKIGEYLPYVL